MKTMKEVLAKQFEIDAYISSAENTEEKRVAYLYTLRESEIQVEKDCCFKEGFVYNVGNELFIEEENLENGFSITEYEDECEDFNYGAVYWRDNIREDGTFDIFYFYFSTRGRGWL